MWVLAYFTEEGQPVTGLSPTVLIKDVDTGADVITGSAMVDIGDGFYRYDFSAYNPTKNYAVTCDSVTLSGVERYTYASSGEYGEVLDSIESTVGVVDIRTTLLRKIQTNRLELFDGDTNNWILYDDDAVTPLLTFSVSDKNGDIIVQCPSSPSKRSGADGVSGVLSPDIYMRKSVYDPDEDGCVTCAENVSDGTYTSTASGVKYAVDNAHHPCMVCTTLVNESTQGDQLVLKYDAATDRIIYGLPNISGSVSGTISHSWLTDVQGGSVDEQYHLTLDQHNTLTNVSGVVDASGQHIHDDRYYTETEINQLIGINKSGIEHLGNGDTGTSVSFAMSFPSANYTLFISVENTTDSPAAEYAVTIDSKTASGFSVHYSGDIDSDNYYLNWYATTSGVYGGNYISELADDPSPELGGTLYINSYGIELDTTPSGEVISGYTVGYSGDISTMSVDWNDTGVGCPLHMKSNGHWEQCVAASGTSRMPCAAMAVEQGTGSKKVLWKGIVRKGAWTWTPGDIIYVSTVEGALTSAAPTNTGSWVQPVGIAIASDTIRFDPGFNPGVINL